MNFNTKTRKERKKLLIKGRMLDIKSASKRFQNFLIAGIF